jgi:two-component system nitrate/nitrite response regulator NarL
MDQYAFLSLPRFSNAKTRTPTRVIIVDDNEAFLCVTIDFLQRHPEIVVVGAHTSCQEALIQARLLQPQIVLVDLEMAGRSGFEAISQLRKELPKAGIIGLTLTEGSAYQGAALLAGANDLVRKSALTSELLPAMRRVLQG